jgi:hypothetical protein
MKSIGGHADVYQYQENLPLFGRHHVMSVEKVVCFFWIKIKDIVCYQESQNTGSEQGIKPWA